MYLGLDLGTGSIKAAVVDELGAVRWIDEQPYDITVSGDRAEFDPETWWSSCRCALRNAPAELLDGVEAVGLSGQMHGLVALGVDNTPIRHAILWPDRRAVDEAAVFAAIERREPGLLANPAGPGMPGPMLLWLREHEPDEFSAIERVVSPKDFLRSRLTGETPVVTDETDASATLMYDARTKAWSPAVLEMIGMPPARLPPIVASSAVAGRISRRAAEQVGLRAGVPVAAGAGDSAAALMGLGIDRTDCVVLNVGTGAQILSLVDDVSVEVIGLGLHQYRTAGPGADWYVMAAVLNAGLALMWVRTLLGLEWGELFDHAGQALASAPGDPVFVPFLVGERDPAVGLDARGAWTGLTASHDRAAMARSALVGVACYLAHRTQQLIDLTGATRVVLSGGSSRSAAWAQLITTLVGHDVHVAVDGHASVRGAARIAATSQGDEIAVPTGPRRLVPDLALTAVGRACISRLLGAEGELLLALRRKSV